MSTRCNRILSLATALVMGLVLCGDTTAALAATLTLPDSLQTIEARAFYGVTSVDEVIIPEGTVTIGAEAFACSSVTKVTVPATVTAIGSEAFYGCESLETVVYGGTVEAWNEMVSAGNTFPDGVTVQCVDGETETEGMVQTTTAVSGTITWVDPEGTCHQPVTVTLLRDGEAVDELQVTGDTYAFGSLAETDPDTGVAYVYTVSIR